MKGSNNVNSWQQRLAWSPQGMKVHLLGIGGAGLSAIANVLIELEAQVSGSDRQENAATQRLADQGARIFIGQAADNLEEMTEAERPDVVLISSAISADNPELLAAQSLGLPVTKRSEFLSALLAERALIAVAGTHGKSTTTSMIVKILCEAGLDPGYIIGAELPGFGNAHAGTNSLFVIEADEYDHMFLGLKPRVAVVTSVEWDHPDCFPTPDDFRAAFAAFLAGVDDQGLIISCYDDDGAEQLRLASNESPRWITYGLSEHADIYADHVQAIAGGGHHASFVWWNAPTGLLELSVPGLYNVRNALAALAVSCWCDVPSSQALASLRTFRSPARRFELKGEANGVTVIDDYAHHPTEIAVTLAGARGRFPDRRIWAVFQPHTFSRTQQMLSEMGESFDDADRVIVTDIFAAREVDDGVVSAGELAATSSHPAIVHIADLCTVADHLAHQVESGDVVITLGAGDSYTVGARLLCLLADGRDAQVASR